MYMSVPESEASTDVSHDALRELRMSSPRMPTITKAAEKLQSDSVKHTVCQHSAGAWLNCGTGQMLHVTHSCWSHLRLYSLRCIYAAL